LSLRAVNQERDQDLAASAALVLTRSVRWRNRVHRMKGVPHAFNVLPVEIALKEAMKLS
jgi:hypothetical protein